MAKLRTSIQPQYLMSYCRRSISPLEAWLAPDERSCLLHDKDQYAERVGQDVPGQDVRMLLGCRCQTWMRS